MTKLTQAHWVKPKDRNRNLWHNRPTRSTKASSELKSFSEELKVFSVEHAVFMCFRVTKKHIVIIFDKFLIFEMVGVALRAVVTKA